MRERIAKLVHEADERGMSLEELQEANRAKRHATLERLAGELASTGLVEETVEELQAGVIGQWLAADDLETRERCWNEVRALEFVRLKLADALAPVESENHAALVETAFDGSRWTRWIKRIRAVYRETR